MRERLYLRWRSEKPQQYSPKWCHSVFKHLQLSFSQQADLLLFGSVESDCLSGCTVKTSELINLRKISTFYIFTVIKLCLPNNCKSRSSKKICWIWIFYICHVISWLLSFVFLLSKYENVFLVNAKLWSSSEWYYSLSSCFDWIKSWRSKSSLKRSQWHHMFLLWVVLHVVGSHVNSDFARPPCKH